MHEGSITLQVPVDLREIPRLNKVVRQFGELHEVPDRTLYAVNLALDELLSNVMLYGYEGTTSDEKIRVQLEVKGSELTAAMEDGGRAFDPGAAPVPDLNAPLEKRQIGGLGIHLVRSLMDEMTYKREGTKNLLTLRKRIR